MFSCVLFFMIFGHTSKAYLLSEEECLNYTVYPVQYELSIRPFIYTGHRYYYDCDAIITVIANSPYVNVIELDAKDLDIKTSTIQVVYEGGVNIVAKAKHDEAKGKLYIYLNQYLKEYNRYKIQYYIKISFAKQVKFDSKGVFVVEYEDHGPKYLLVTRLEPNKAKYFFPCFDNPQFEAVFKFKIYEITHPEMQHTNTSLVISEEQKRHNEANYVVIDYISSPQVGVHQVGFHHSIFTSQHTVAKRTNDTLYVWAPAKDLHYYNYILQFGERIINLIHDYSKINRPLVYGPINIISIPSYSVNGYEIGSWNLLTNGVHKLAYIQHITSIKQLERMKFDLAQHLCRIWLGNPGEIQRTRWTEEWFKEGVATYLAYYFLAQYDRISSTQKWRMGDYGLQMKHKAMSMDWHHTTPTLISFNRTLAIDIPARYRELVTMKTASLLWMVENWVGAERFHQALANYINSRRGKFISLVDFTASLDHDTVDCEEQFFNGSTASRVLYSWFTRSGYPVINVRVVRDRNPNAVQLKQRQFSFTNSSREDTNFLIPISYIVQKNKNCFNCYRPRFTIGTMYTFEENLNEGWIILNRNASGYYRVNYDDYTWRLIARSLMNNLTEIDTLNRAQIVNDVFALYTAGDMNFPLAIEILMYLDKERSETVWEAAINGFSLLKIDDANCHMTRGLYEEWKTFMREKLSSAFNRLFYDLEQQPEIRLLRSSIIDFACTLGYKNCINELRQVYSSKPISDPDIRQTCYWLRINDNKGNYGILNLNHSVSNQFEIEDIIQAEHRWQEENRFTMKIPPGQSPGRPIPVIMSTLPPPIEVTTLYSPAPTKSSHSLSGCISVTLIALIATVVVVLF